MENHKKKNFAYRHILSASLEGVIVSLLLVTHVFASPITSENILKLLNEERSERNISKLDINPDLNNAAFLKSKDMINRDYFEHFAFGLSPWAFIKNSGYDYLYAGENLAMDFSTSEGMVRSWMNSPTHRDNILNPDYRDIGIGIVKGEYSENNSSHSTTMVTNMFGRKKPTIIKVFEYITGNLFGNIF